MGGWYLVIKTIKGRQYRYRQRTWREGKHVRTESYSLGPVSGGAPGGSTSQKPASGQAQHIRELVKEHLLPVFSQLSDRLGANASWDLPWHKGAQSGESVRQLPILESVITASKVRVESHPEIAAYHRSLDCIFMPAAGNFRGSNTRTATDAYYFTLLHELTHWTGHNSRLGRFREPMRFGNPAYAREELIAEATAVIVLRALGRQPPDMSVHTTYFCHWLDKTGDTEAAISYAIGEAEKAATFILSLGVNTTNENVV